MCLEKLGVNQMHDVVYLSVEFDTQSHPYDKFELRWNLRVLNKFPF